MCVHTHTRALCTHMCAHEMDRGRKTGYTVTVSRKSFEINDLRAKPGRLRDGFRAGRRLRQSNLGGQDAPRQPGGFQRKGWRHGCRSAEKTAPAGRQQAARAAQRESGPPSQPSAAGASLTAQASQAPALADSAGVRWPGCSSAQARHSDEERALPPHAESIDERRDPRWRQGASRPYRRCRIQVQTRSSTATAALATASAAALTPPPREPGAPRPPSAGSATWSTDASQRP